ncbi:MAG: FAD-dependent oxidoreductase [Anaerolineales bacterium]|nr:FAD-dependent oxidoreductase [Anaerolineales bacterium]MCB9126519.1 FAD-dependent oxidoreductase [Ardenticatenales bacterium]
MNQQRLGDASRPLRVAIIGAGPSGFYAASALTKQGGVEVEVDIFDKLPTPFGLVRQGVAPDHPKIKSVERAYHRTARQPEVRFFGNVEFGRDINRAELRDYYDQIVYAVGAPSDRRLKIAGESLLGSVPATEFVAWYNGHPDYAALDFALDGEDVVVVGNGNVAVDVARILARSVDELATTDIADHALQRLRESKVKRIHMLGRRGPAQAKFTTPELRELGELAGVDVVVDPADLALNPISAVRADEEREIARNLEILQAIADKPLTGAAKQLHLRFFVSPVEVVGDGRRMTGVVLERNRLEVDESGYQRSVGTGERALLPAQLMLRAVGYYGVPLPDLPFDDRRGTLPNVAGRLIDPATNEVIRGEYVVGWAKRGPTGVIGTNKADATETVAQMVEDLPLLSGVAADKASAEAAEAWVRAKQPNVVSYEDWELIDQVERERGEPLGKPRQKICHREEMLALIASAKAQEGAHL